LTLVVAVWGALVTLLAYRGAFATPADKPQLAILAAMLLPALAFIAVMRLSSAFRSNILAIDPVWLCAAQGWRMIGGAFLFVYGFGHLPGVFAYQAGWGDMLVGFLAPFAEVRLVRDPSFLASRTYWSFHLLGVLDLLLAPVTGAIISTVYPATEIPTQIAQLGSMPLVMIVALIVPAFLCLHIAAFAQIRAARGRV
jgi:hypothetical protein